MDGWRSRGDREGVMTYEGRTAGDLSVDRRQAERHARRGLGVQGATRNWRLRLQRPDGSLSVCFGPPHARPALPWGTSLPILPSILSPHPSILSPHPSILSPHPSIHPSHGCVLLVAACSHPHLVGKCHWSAPFLPQVAPSRHQAHPHLAFQFWLSSLAALKPPTPTHHSSLPYMYITPPVT
jgi:hypothetical protein